MINISTFLLKIHYFLLFGGIASLESYGVHYSMPLGASLAVMVTLGVVVLACILLLKPALAMAVDAFPRSRQPLFVCTVALLCTSAFFMIFVPAFKRPPSYSTVWAARRDANVSSLCNGGPDAGQGGVVDLGDYESCRALTHASDRNYSNSTYLRFPELEIILTHNDTCKMREGVNCRYGSGSVYLQLMNTGYSSSGYSTYSVSAPAEAFVQCYNDTSESILRCKRGDYYESDDCGGSAVHSAAFWCFAFLLLTREFTSTTTVSFTDAITLDTIGNMRNYGWQRMWGIVGWGLAAPFGRALVNYFNEAGLVKDHSKAFAFASIFFAADVIVSFFIKAPVVQQNGKVWSGAKRLMRDSKFLLFLFFSLMSGIFYWVAHFEVPYSQWQMIMETPTAAYASYLSLALVLTRFLCELPWMYYADRLMKKFGARKLFTAIFVAHVLRLSLNAAVFMWGPVWATFIVELLNGPVHGLGYPLVVLYARQFTPPGLTNTVQSLANNAYDMLSLGIFAAVTLTASQLVSMYAVPMFWVYAAFAAITAVLHLVCHLRGALLENDGRSIRDGDSLQMRESDSKGLLMTEDYLIATNESVWVTDDISS